MSTFDAEIDLWEHIIQLDRSVVESLGIDNIFDEDLRVVIFIKLGFL